MLEKHVVVLCAVALVTFVSCVNYQSGRDFDATKAQTFQKGKTSRADVIAVMGEPSSTGNNSDGSFIEYQYETIKGGGVSSLLSVYGIGSSSVDDKVKLCRFMFDAKDKLKDRTCSEGKPNYSSFV